MRTLSRGPIPCSLVKMGIQSSVMQSVSVFHKRGQSGSSIQHSSRSRLSSNAECSVRQVYTVASCRNGNSAGLCCAATDWILRSNVRSMSNKSAQHRHWVPSIRCESRETFKCQCVGRDESTQYLYTFGRKGPPPFH